MAQWELTGKRILSTLRRKHGWAAFGYLILTLWFAAIMIFSVVCFGNGDIAIGIIALLVGLLTAGVFGHKLIQNLKVALNPHKATVFRKYGDPEVIADRIFVGRENILLEQNHVVITADYILHRKHYETFVPIADVLLMYRKEHRTYGSLDAISLVVHDRYGDSYEYPFKLGNKFAGDMDYAVGEIIKLNPECRIGYDRQNLQYVKANKQPIPD